MTYVTPSQPSICLYGALCDGRRFRHSAVCGGECDGGPVEVQTVTENGSVTALVSRWASYVRCALIEGWHHVDLATRPSQSCHMTTLQPLDTARARSHANLKSLLTTHLTTSIRSQFTRWRGIGQIDRGLTPRRSSDSAGLIVSYGHSPATRYGTDALTRESELAADTTHLTTSIRSQHEVAGHRSD